jgi:uncharacterized sulfatase
MKALQRVALLMLAAVWLAALGASHARAAEARPNFLVVLVDDLGYGDFSCYGNTRTKTVNIDRLAQEGLRFTQFYVSSPICSPSRCALITGQYPARWKITSYIDNRALNEQRGMAQFLDLKAPTLARSLSRAGYATGHFGKWHLGGGRDVGEAPLITEYGFDRSLTQFEGLGDRVLPLLDAHDGQPAPKMPLGVASEKLGRGTVTWQDRCQVTRSFVERAVDFMKQAERDGKPFYVNVWPDDVHSPFFPPAELRGDGSKSALYQGVLANMDRQFGPLFDYVRQSPTLRKNTVIVLLSDNGPEAGAGVAGDLRGSKGQLYEGGVREPLIVWAPGLMPAAKVGTTNETSVLSSVDLVPSLLRLSGAAGVEGVGADGMELSDTLLGKAAGTRTKPLFWKRPPDRPGPPRNPLPDLAVREGNWKLLVMADGSGAQLYDLAADRTESRNVAAEHPDVAERLRKALLEWNGTLPK